MACLESFLECTLHGTVLLRRVRCRQLASDPEVVAVFHERMVKNPHISDEALHIGEDGGRTFVAGAVWVLEVGGAVHEPNDVP